MNKNIDLVVFGTFGIPHGFRQTILSENKSISSNIKTFDLNTNAIKIFPNTKVFSIRKNQSNGKNIIAYSIYSFAKEKNSDRGGTFIGSSIIFNNCIPSEDLVLNYLEEFHDELISNKKNVDNNIIQVNHSDQLHLPKKMKTSEKMALSLKEIDDINFSISNKQVLIYSLIKPELFKKSLELLNVYDTIFITKSKDIAEFVYEKQLIKLVGNDEDFEIELQKYRVQKEEAQKRRLEQAIDKVQREIYSFDDENHQFNFKINHVIDTERKSLEENRLQINKFQSQYDIDKQQIEHFINQYHNIRDKLNQQKTHLQNVLEELKSSPKQIEEILYRLDTSQREIQELKIKLQSPNINRLSDTQNRKNIVNRSYVSQSSSNRDDSSTSRKKSSSSVWISWLLFILWISTTLYFLFFHNNINLRLSMF